MLDYHVAAVGVAWENEIYNLQSSPSCGPCALQDNEGPTKRGRDKVRTIKQLQKHVFTKSGFINE